MQNGKSIEINSEQYLLTFTHNWVSLFKSSPSKQKVKIETVEDSDSSLNNKYFLLPTPDKIYAFFFNIQGTGHGPNASKFFSQVEINLDSSNKSADEIAQTIKNKLDSEHSTEFETSIENNVLIVTNKDPGKPLYNYNPRDANTNFLIDVLEYGEDEYSLVKSGFPEKQNRKYGTFLYEIIDIDVEYTESNSDINMNLKVDGVFRTSKKITNEYNKPVWTNEFELSNKKYEKWVTL